MDESLHLDDGPSQVVTPKSFFVKERDGFYSSWPLAFWRELFQNAVDAGAKNIGVKVEDVAARGSFGNAPSDKEVFRIVFEDDGCGMTKEVLNDVYFRIGASTKDDETTVGGFGRARLMTCFSQDRYAIRTLDRVVEGDGGAYMNLSKAEAEARMKRWAERLRTQADAAAAPEAAALARAAAGRLDEDLGRLSAESAVVRGCRVEIDVVRHDSYPRINKETLLDNLEAYLGLSEVKCKVAVNGVAHERKKVRIEGRRNLVANMRDDEVPEAWRSNPSVEIVPRPGGANDVVFGRLMLVKDNKVAEGSVVVRVNGAWMFSQQATDLKADVHVELVPAIAREVLTSNRDGLKPAFKRAIDDLLALLATDSQKALAKDDESDFELLRGGKGAKAGRAKAPDVSGDVEVGGTARVLHQQVKARAEKMSTYINFDGDDYDWRKFMRNEYDDLDKDRVLGVFDQLKAVAFEATFLRHYKDRQLAELFLAAVKERGPRAALTVASGNLLGFVADHVKLIRIAEVEAERDQNAERMKGLHDVPILKESLSIPADRFGADEVKRRRAKLLTAIRRHDPRNWDEGSGKGMLPRKVLAAWSVAVDRCVELLFEAYPNTKPFDYSCGWLFNHPQWEWDSLKSDSGWKGTAAMARHEKGEDKHVAFLLNPLDASREFNVAFSPSSADDRDRIIALAVHEVTHALVSGHGDSFATVMTALVERMNSRVRRQVHLDMQAAFRVIDTVYAAGKTRVAALDAGAGVRPAERYMEGLPPEAEQAAVDRSGPVTVYDNGLLEERERLAVDAASEEFDEGASTAFPSM